MKPVGTYKGRREENPGEMMFRHKGVFKSAWNAEQYKNKMIAAGFEAKVVTYTDGYSVYVLAPHDFWKDQFVIDNTRPPLDASFAAMHPAMAPRRNTRGSFQQSYVPETETYIRDPPEMRRFSGDDFELLGGNPQSGFATQEEAKQIAKEWLVYPEGGHVRVVLWHGRWYAYGN